MNLSDLYYEENLLEFQEDIKFLINSEIRLKILGKNKEGQLDDNGGVMFG